MQNNPILTTPMTTTSMPSLTPLVDTSMTLSAPSMTPTTTQNNQQQYIVDTSSLFVDNYSDTGVLLLEPVRWLPQNDALNTFADTTNNNTTNDNSTANTTNNNTTVDNSTANTTNNNTTEDTESKSSHGFFYIIQTADVEKNVYKIGKTTQTDPNKRLCRYPAYSNTKYTIHCDNADVFEDLVMRKFKTLFKRRMEYGIEYYEGDITIMIDEVHKLWMRFNKSTDIQLDKDIEKFKPNGWQYFVNEWLCYNTTATMDTAYDNYVKIMTDVFSTNEYAEKNTFMLYYAAMDI
jgi:hypothetical protein